MVSIEKSGQPFVRKTGQQLLPRGQVFCADGLVRQCSVEERTVAQRSAINNAFWSERILGLNCSRVVDEIDGRTELTRKFTRYLSPGFDRTDK